jgi:hypothetical protein
MVRAAGGPGLEDFASESCVAQVRISGASSSEVCAAEFCVFETWIHQVCASGASISEVCAIEFCVFEACICAVCTYALCRA